MDTVTEKKFAAGLSIVSNAAVISLKLLAGIATGSISVISEAIHSMSDFLASAITFFAVSRSSEPADQEHPYGHGKYEDMAGFVEGLLIVFAAFYIIFEAVKKIKTGVVEEFDSIPGISVMAFAIVANYIVSKYLFHVAEKTESVSLHADGEHLRTDIWSSAGVLIGLLLIKLTGITMLDPIIALIVAVIILKTGFHISKNTLNNLLDGSLPQEELEMINEIIQNNCHFESPVKYKNIKARRSGQYRDIEITILCPRDMTVEECHTICDKIEVSIKEKYTYANITIHAEPRDY